MARIVPSERYRDQLDELIAGASDNEDPVEEIARAGARLVLQVALENEVTEFLGRERYERDGKPVAYRNGYEERKVVTTSGPVEVERPRIREAEKLGFESRVLGKGVTRTHARESLVICSFLRGLSTRDVEAALAETFEEKVISRSTVSRVCEDTRERYRRWCERDLKEHDLVYCFLDAIYLKLRPHDTPAEGVLCAWGITPEGRKVLLGLQLGSRESYECWLDFGRDMKERGLKAPALVIADGAQGIWKAVGELWPAAAQQRCTVHYADVGITFTPCATSSPSSPSATTPSSRRAGGRSSRRPPRLGRRRLPCLPSPRSSGGPIPRRCGRSTKTSMSWSPTCSFLPSTANGCGRRTCWSAPSSRCDAAPR
jgi:putative transposase